MRTKTEITRRRLLQSLGLGGAGAVSGLCLPQSALADPVKPRDIAAATQIEGACRLLPEAVEGPFYFDPELLRRDIRDGKDGQKIELVLKIVDGASCEPIPGARVDIWHADARGVYSGYDGQGDQRETSAKGETYLRGTQFSETDGLVRFTSIYPGWYPGRTPHIHVKIFIDDKTVLTGQAYFPTDLSNRIYKTIAPYNQRPVADTDNKNDWLFNKAISEGGGIVMTAESKTDAERDELIVSLVIAVDKTGQAAGGGIRS